MKNPVRSRLRAAVALTVGATLVALGASACGTVERTDAARAPAASPTLDKTLRGLLPERVLQTGVLRVGTDAAYPPMSSFGPDGRTIVGMEPDLGAALGRVLGIKLEFVHMEFSSILPQVRDGVIDVGIAAMTDTAEREKQVDFVNYLSAGTSILVQRGNPSAISDLADLCGKTVALEQGTIQVDLVRRAQPNCGTNPIKLATYPTNSDALVQLRTGRANAVLNDFAPAAFLTTDARTKAHYQLASTTQYEPGQYGVAVNKSQPAIRDALAGALSALDHDGTYKRILDHWGVSAGAVDDVTVNSGS
ncbi:ABC transporter substrate-binding protein [Angustibacter sp. McL0619]|uniref:ABC transporter substrate-binding protein n=1 Tax=Angustibacter sp. McL0619 TaxID=3415676 RepID=UPI003CF62F26